MRYLTEDLVSALKRTCLPPTGQTTFTDPDDFISLFNEEMELKLVPKIMSVRQDYFLTYQLVTLLDKVNHYAVPERSIGNTLKDIFYVPDVTNLEYRFPLARGDVHSSINWNSSGFPPVEFFHRGDEVQVRPPPTNPTGSLMLWYQMRPNKLVSTSSCAKVTAVSTVSGTTTFTVDTDLTASLAVGALLDPISGKSPFRARYIDVAITAITSTTIAVAATSVQDEGGNTTVVVGDYLCPAQQTCIPMIPQEFHPILSEMGARRVMKALGATQNYAVLKGEVDILIADALGVIANRTESEPELLYDQNSLVNSMGGMGPSVLWYR